MMPAEETDSPYGGVVAAAVTPCKAPGAVDSVAMTRLCAALVQHGCHGVFVAGSTGELPLLGEVERRAVIGAAREGINGKATLYAGVSGTGIGQTLTHIRHAQAEGADVAVIMAPFFLRLAARELEEYVRVIADQSPLPLGLYHHLRMNAAFEVESVARLAQHPNIVAFKDTSADIARFAALVEATRGCELALLQGSEPYLLASLQAGGHGCVTALACIVPEWHRSLFDAWSHRDSEAALKYQQAILRVTELFALPEIKLSSSAFCRAIKIGIRERGWLSEVENMLPAAVPGDFDSRVTTILARCRLPEAGAH